MRRPPAPVLLVAAALVGIGDHDEDLLARIAGVTNGRYVRR